MTASVDYAVRAVLELAARPGERVKGDAIAAAQGLSFRFVERLLADLRRAGIVASQRGHEGGYWLARPAAAITVADVIRAVEGPLANVRGSRPETVEYAGPAGRLQDVWVALRANMRAVLEELTLADVASGELPPEIAEITARPGAWDSH